MYKKRRKLLGITSKHILTQEVTIIDNDKKSDYFPKKAFEKENHSTILTAHNDKFFSYRMMNMQLHPMVLAQKDSILHYME